MGGCKGGGTGACRRLSSIPNSPAEMRKSLETSYENVWRRAPAETRKKSPLGFQKFSFDAARGTMLYF